MPSGCPCRIIAAKLYRVSFSTATYLLCKQVMGEGKNVDDWPKPGSALRGVRFRWKAYVKYTFGLSGTQSLLSQAAHTAIMELYAGVTWELAPPGVRKVGRTQGRRSMGGAHIYSPQVSLGSDEVGLNPQS
jgi:hypothetical protein